MNFGLALDIGTTTVDIRLYGDAGATLHEKNRQYRFGADVISRIAFANAETGSKRLLKTTILRQIEDMASRLPVTAETAPGQAVLTGNTAMLHFVTGYSTAGMGSSPFQPESLFGFELPWGRLCAPEYVPQILPADMSVFLPPCPGPFTGADLITAVMAILLRGESGPFLLADIGTNCEMAFCAPGDKGGSPVLICAASAAGPAFEGGGIQHGMGAAPGAICRVIWQMEGFAVETLDNQPPKGLCGAGLVSALASCLDAGLVNSTGLITNGDLSATGAGAAGTDIVFHTNPRIFLTQKDIRRLQLAKGAVRAGLEIILEEAGYGGEAIPFYLCGAFGSALQPGDALRIGLIPPAFAGRVIAAGNAALEGAALLLFSQEHRGLARSLAKNARSLNLAEHAAFQSRFIEALNF
jgi:uncharacterized 2Fe-2S/4Fe-4S cluster protein (DUF4445 family)